MSCEPLSCEPQMYERLPLQLRTSRYGQCHAPAAVAPRTLATGSEDKRVKEQTLVARLGAGGGERQRQEKPRAQEGTNPFTKSITYDVKSSLPHKATTHYHTTNQKRLVGRAHNCVRAPSVNNRKDIDARRPCHFQLTIRSQPETHNTMPLPVRSMLLCPCYALAFFFFIHSRLAAAVSFSFDFSISDYASELNYSNDSHWVKPMVELTKDQRYQGITGSVGRVWYARPVPIWDRTTRRLASFNTTFSFHIKFGGDSRAPGDGMAFFLSYYPSVTPANSAGGTLGLFSGRFRNAIVSGDERVVAVEFDTHDNGDGDNSGSQHVGIDVNNIVSVASTNTDIADRNLTSGLTMQARVTYRNDTMVLSADLQIGDTPYHVSTNVDLRDCLPEAVAVGFSASTGDFFELHELMSWSFDSDLQVVPPRTAVNASAATAAAAPAQQATHDDDGARKHRRVRPEILALAVVSGLLCLVVLLLIGCTFKMASRWCQRHARDKLGHGPRQYQYSELVRATNRFDAHRKLGTGASGEVYLGDDNGRRVAVKRLSSGAMTDAEAQRRRRREFEAEVDIISRLRHKNLVRLFGWCDSSNGLLLVYELISQGSLDNHLYGNETDKPLKHSGTKYVVHGDIKPSNIMLDEELNAKLGDFGLARLVDHSAAARTTESVMGTPGYVEPEFAVTGKRCVESDVYSFGIVLLEIVTGHGPRSQPSLRSQVWELYGQGRVVEAASAKLMSDSEANDLQMIQRVLVPARSERPSISHAMRVLEHADAPLPVLTLCHGRLTTLQSGISKSQEQRRETSPLLSELSLDPRLRQFCGRSHGNTEQGSSVVVGKQQ
ncbi:hypothetical protein HU200_013777 [Digitaria exilis]|uniref:non-specific serine/threonine protein kinase n=1 Tax=Digitaria exilis TaxID=1010633 RepID=A0A835FCJ4_9POAL|nr:hypothetical protein HU200_013777 [Digitaria exilis]